jgi:pilus assembly protein CpaC
MLLVACTLLSHAALSQEPASPQNKPQPLSPQNKPSLVYKVQSPNERMEMTVHTSRILTMEQKIPQAQVNNPDLLELTPLSPNQIQVSAKAPGVTQINLWGEDKKLFTIDVMVYGDAQELALMLRSTFPNSALKVVPVANSVMISGFVDTPEHIDRIIRIAEEYYPKVINNMTVGGVQLLHVKVMAVSRTKLRRLGFDWAKITGSNVVASSASGMILQPTSPALPSGLGSSAAAAATVSNNPVGSDFAFNIAGGTSAFFGVLDALRQDNLLKVMAEPTLVTVSGRAASFESGGNIFIPVPQSLGTISLQPYQYGTRIDFVPIVLGNGKVRLEVRPRISELDYANSITIQGTTVPGTLERSADTGVEMMAGQTLAIAGLVQSRVEAENHALPWVGEVPYLRLLFGRIHETVNEVELLIMVTPELVDAMDADQVPKCGPGMETTSPSDWELFMKGHIEVPKCPPRDACDNGANGKAEDCPDELPPDGMIERAGEKIPTPPPTDSGSRSTRPVRNGPDAAAPDASAGKGRSTNPQSRQTSSKPTASEAASAKGSQNGPPGFIGPVGYDVVK